MKDPEATHAAGDRSPGTIGVEGVYLDGGTGWYPGFGRTMGLFDVNADVPEGWDAVSQGRPGGKARGGGRARVTWTNSIPADGCSLVAGPYVVNTTKWGRVTISTYLHAEHASLSPTYLEAAKRFLEFFSGRLCPYPYPHFSIVENFYDTGYGMPGFTLLGSNVVAKPERYAGAVGLGHEILHCWWGNYVFVDETDGNWCEGLTTYGSNYGWVEAIDGPEAAGEARRKMLEHYSVIVNDRNTYPLRQFGGKVHEVDNEVGYTKAAMLFHLVRRRIGDAAFDDALREVLQTHGGRRASWATFADAFSRHGGESLDVLFSQWLDRSGEPAVSLTSPRVEPVAGGKGVKVRFTLTQGTPPWSLRLPVRIRGPNDSLRQTVTLDETRAEFEFGFSEPPESITVDPDDDLLRRLGRTEVAPCLNLTRHDSPRLLVYPTGGTSSDKPTNEALRAMADRLFATGGWEMLADTAVTDESLTRASCLLLGSAATNVVTARLMTRGASSVRATGEAGAFTVDGVRIAEADAALLLSVRHPSDPVRTVTYLWPNGAEAAAASGRFLLYYGWDQYVVLRKGMAAERGTFDPRPSAARHEFSRVSSVQGLQMHALVQSLSAPEMRGRGNGSPEILKAAGTIAEAFRQAGLHPGGNDGGYLQPFTILLQDIDAERMLPTMEVTRGEKGSPPEIVSLGAEFLPANRTSQGSVDADTIAAGFGIHAPEYGWSDYEGLDVAKKVVLVRAGEPAEWGEKFGTKRATPHAGLWRKALAAQRAGAAALVVVLPSAEEAGSVRAPAMETMAAWPAWLPDRQQKKLAGPEAALHGETGATLATSLQSRQPLPPYPVALPCLVVRGRSWEEVVTRSHLRFGVALTEKTTPAANVVGILPGADPSRAHEAVILGAHYDHLGVDAQGTPFPGANDNASGVAALISIARAFGETATRPSRTIVFVAFAGEELGLWGSQAFVANPPVKMRDVVAMLNVDMCGRGGRDELALIGVLRNPSLAREVEAANASVGLQLKTDIEFAFPWGSDHWPFHVAGVPSLDFTSSLFPEYHTIGDTADRLDPMKMERSARLLYLTAHRLAWGTGRFPFPKEVEVPYLKREGGK
ncbi:MAG: M20/M25/M40 family metallo-hydrolase [Planctomycetes bacterium]|nr:M20/M25/M40 family metallo-hydrolase [Planctomycetota bacterium]